MEFSWDSRKAASNLKKHGIPFPIATRVFLDEYRIERLDESEDYGESRFTTTGIVDGLEIVVVYTLREDNVRVISARKADPDEIEAYWNR
ncbi:MAG: BrnT family toxin [Silvibacterium sp.]